VERRDCRRGANIGDNKTDDKIVCFGSKLSLKGQESD
jgi:hypothetical protein